MCINKIVIFFCNGSLDEANEVLETTDVETSEVKYKYPRAIPFIISNEFCERFNFYGMKAILVIYLTQKLFYSDDAATAIYHIFSASVYFFCNFGRTLCCIQSV